MSSAAHLEMPRVNRPALRPLALPTEHGGWGFLFEPVVLGLAVAPSLAGLTIALAFTLAFLARQPLKLAMQDALRGRSYPRTRWCRLFASAYSAGALAALAGAVALSGREVLLPLAIVAPIGLLQLVFDARNHSRSLLPELGGTIAMTSSAAAIAVAAGMPLLPALALSGIVAARGVPAVVYVRTLLQRAHGKTASSQPAIALHLLAVGVVMLIATKLATVAMAILLVRAAWQLTREKVPPAKRIGWTEVAFGLLTVALAAIGEIGGF